MIALTITSRPPIIDDTFLAPAEEAPSRGVSVWLVLAGTLALCAALWLLGAPWWLALAPVWAVPVVVLVALPVWAAFVGEPKP